MSDPKTYSGACHCGKVRYEVELDLGGRVLACNCSICAKTGAVLAFVPADKFTLLAGDDAQTDYLFNKKTIHHLFCTTCGIRSFARGTMRDGTPMCAINLRCLEGVDIDALTITRFDGKSM